MSSANASKFAERKSQCTTMYKNNSGLIAKTKQNKYKKGLCLIEKLVHKNPLLFLYETVIAHLKNDTETNV